MCTQQRYKINCFQKILLETIGFWRHPPHSACNPNQAELKRWSVYWHKQNEEWKEDIFAIFINIPKRSMGAVAFSAISGCCAAGLEGLSASGSPDHSLKLPVPWQDTAHDRKAAEMVPVFTAKQTHLCPYHRLTHGHFSPSLLSRGKAAFLPYSDTRWVLQHVLGNCLVSFAGKTGFFSSSPLVSYMSNSRWSWLGVIPLKTSGSVGSAFALHKDLWQAWLYLEGCPAHCTPAAENVHDLF